MHHHLTKYWSISIHFAQTYPIRILVITFCVGIGTILFYTTRTTNNLIKSTAIHNAELYAAAIKEFRTIYSSEVIPAAKANGIEITHDYKNKKKSLPLPATLSILLGNQIDQQGAGIQTKLYSPYPFPWRREKGGLQDQFGTDAWAALNKNPGQPYYQFENIDGRSLLRYAMADRMRASCIDCHNTHPDTPKNGWRVGDTRGVLEIIYPIDAAVAQASSDFRGTTSLLIALAVFSLVGIATAIIGLRRTAEKTKKVNKQLKQSNQELDDFAYIASHDLKEPLRGIHNYSTFLIEDYQNKIDEDGMAKLATLQRLTKRMEKLIDTLLEFSRVGRVDMAYKETDLNQVLDDVVESLQVRLDETGIDVRTPTPLPIIQCDSARIGEVFRNLITNAMKYNDKPEKWIEVSVVENTQRRNTLGINDNQTTIDSRYIFYVEDNGIGIPPKHQGSIFRIFKRLHGRDQFGGGTGAGLTIVKKIVERHGGKVWVESTHGQGTKFKFTLGKAA